MTLLLLLLACEPLPVTDPVIPRVFGEWLDCSPLAHLGIPF